MMTITSAGILLYRRRGKEVEILLAHPGGPYWRKKDEGAWSIPKGEIEPGEDEQAAARREFAEETGLALKMQLAPLGSVIQKGGKIVEAFTAEGDADATSLKSNEFTIEWPPRSGQSRSFPEVDRFGWFTLKPARAKILAAQIAFIDRLERHLALSNAEAGSQIRSPGETG